MGLDGYNGDGAPPREPHYSDSVITGPCYNPGAHPEAHSIFYAWKALGMSIPEDIAEFYVDAARQQAAFMERLDALRARWEALAMRTRACIEATRREK
jgi:hypothetical protein